MAARRERLGEPPTPEELLDYRDGRLGEAERRQVEEKIRAFPDAARSLADLAAFPDVKAADGVKEVSDEEVAARWKSFRSRLEGADEPAPGASVAGTTGPNTAGTRWWWPASPRWAVAALAFALGLAAGLLIVRSSPQGAAVNVTIAQLAPEAASGERTVNREEVEVPESAEAWVLVLGLIDGLGYSTYSAVMVDARGAEVWTGHGLTPTAAGTFHLAFSRRFLPPGDYRIFLHGLEAGERVEVAVYSFRLTGG